MSLLQQKTSIEKDPRLYLTAIHGEAGVGKTTWAAAIGGHYFLMCEMGAKGIEVYGEPILEWKKGESSFLGKCAELVVAKTSGWKDQREVKTIVIDGTERFYNMCGQHIVDTETFPSQGAQIKVSRLEDAPYGKGYKRVNQVIETVLNKLMLNGFGVILLGHTKERTVKWGGQELQAYNFNLPPSAALGIEGMCDAVGYFTVSSAVKKNDAGEVISYEEGRWQFWQGTFLRTAKHRLKKFPERLPLQLDDGYATYLEAFEETLKGAAEQETDNKVTEQEQEA